MQRLLSVFLVLLGCTALARAQSQEEYQRVFQKGYDAVIAGDYDAGIEAFKQCHEWRPDAPIPTYNLACCYSLKKELDEAFGWLEKAVSLGYTDTEFWSNDTDLDNLRADPRYAQLVERVESLKKIGEEYAKEAAVYVPAAVQALSDAGESVPLLFVLHDTGSTKEKVIAGHWRKVADSLGFVLVAPSGKYLSMGAESPAGGMAWWDNLANYSQRPWKYETTVDDAYKVLKKKHKVDRKRVYIAGVGEGCVPAMNIAVTYPGLYKGVVLVNGMFSPQISGPKGANAGKMGLKARMLVDSTFELPGSPQEFGVGVGNLFKTWNIDFRFAQLSGEDPVLGIVEAVGSLAPEEKAPAEAGSTGSGS